METLGYYEEKLQEFTEALEAEKSFDEENENMIKLLKFQRWNMVTEKYVSGPTLKLNMILMARLFTFVRKINTLLGSGKFP